MPGRIETQIEKRPEDTVGAGEGGLNRESGTEKHTASHANQSATRKFPHNLRRSTRGPVTSPRGGMRRGAGGGFKREGICEHLWLLHGDAWQKPVQHWKATILQK